MHSGVHTGIYFSLWSIVPKCLSFIGDGKKLYIQMLFVGGEIS